MTETVSFVGSWSDSKQIAKEVFSGLNNYNKVTLHFTLKANNSDDVEQTENTDKNTIDFKIVHMGDDWPTLECLRQMSGFNEEYSEVKLDAKDYAEPKEFSLKLTSSDISNIVSNGMAFQGLYYTVSDVYIIGENEGSEYPGVKMTDVFDLYGLAQSNVSSFDEFKGAYVKGAISSDADSDDGSMTVADLSPIVGVDGVFNEKASPDATGAFLCNLDKYSTLLRPQNGVQYTVSESSEVSLEFFYGSTSYYNSFGYFYYDANDSQEEILKKPKFLLMYDARPSVNIQIKDPQNINFTPNYWTYWDLSPYTTYSFFDGKDYPDPENGYMNTGNSWAASKQLDRRIEVYDKNTEIYETAGDYSRFKSTIHKLVYYPINPDGSLGTGTYTFPAGTRIGFFIITNGKSSLEYSDVLRGSINSGRISFSLPWMNKAIGNTMSSDHTHADDSSSTYEDGDDGWTAFVTYLWNGKYVLGAEDGTPGGDRDMNDVLFYVKGNISSDEPVEDLSTQDVKVQSWMLAVEDLGGAYDYDFNDLVIGISHYSTNVYENGSLSSTTPANYFTVTGIAAGGTLPVYLKYNGKQIGGEFHSWFGLSSDRVHNANNFNGVAEKRYHVACDDNFSLSRNENKVDTEGTGLEGFTVEVKRNDNTTYEVTNTNYGTTTAPQMILFPGQWRHPKEGVHITNAYSDKFLQWVKNHKDENARKWVNERKSGMTVNHQWSGENAPKDGKYSYKYDEVK